MKPIKDRFSKQSRYYKKYRPVYPQELYNTILRHARVRDRCWDCATGNGQVAVALSTQFKNVIATDISSSQLSMAEKRDNILYELMRAEETSFPDNSFDLITVGQAIHWFDIDAFFKEVDRVLKPGGLLAVWGYDLLEVSPLIDKCIRFFYEDTIKPYWDDERHHIDNRYKEIDFPFNAIPMPKKLFVETLWSLEHLNGYLNSWSGVQRYKEANNKVNPVLPLIELLTLFWRGDLTVRFPLFLELRLKH